MTDAPTPFPRLTPGRDEAGRFGPGNRASQGRTPNSITRELRRQVDPAGFVARLIAIYDDPKTNAREVIQIAQLIGDRLEGKPISRSLTMTVGAAQVLPAGFDALEPAARRQALIDLRARAVAGEAFEDVGADDDGE